MMRKKKSFIVSFIFVVFASFIQGNVLYAKENKSPVFHDIECKNTYVDRTYTIPYEASHAIDDLALSEDIEEITLYTNKGKRLEKWEVPPKQNPTILLPFRPTLQTVQTEEINQELPTALANAKEEYVMSAKAIPLSMLLKYGNGCGVVAKYITIENEKYGIVNFQILYSGVEKRVGEYDVQVLMKDGTTLNGKINVVEDRKNSLVSKRNNEEDCFIHWMMLVLTVLLCLYESVSVLKVKCNTKNKHHDSKNSKEEGKLESK